MWGVPVDHEMFSEINNAQWLWYYYNMLEDRKESFEGRRDLVEYHASFIEPEAVQKIRKSRDEAVELTHDDFITSIESVSGRKISLDKERRKGAESHTVTHQGIGSRVQQPAPKEYKTPNHQDWLNMELE